MEQKFYLWLSYRPKYSLFFIIYFILAYKSTYYLSLYLPFNKIRSSYLPSIVDLLSRRALWRLLRLSQFNKSQEIPFFICKCNRCNKAFSCFQATSFYNDRCKLSSHEAFRPLFCPFSENEDAIFAKNGSFSNLARIFTWINLCHSGKNPTTQQSTTIPESYWVFRFAGFVFAQNPTHAAAAKKQMGCP